MNDILSSNFRSRIVGIYGFLVAVNSEAWVWAIIAFHDKPVLIGTAVLDDFCGRGREHSCELAHIVRRGDEPLVEVGPQGQHLDS